MQNAKLFNYITKRLEGACNFVNTHMPINAETDVIYEGIVGEPHVCEAFANAVQYLPPVILSCRADVSYGERILQLRINLDPTDKYPVFLLPKYDLKINSQSEFGKALALPLEVALKWYMLIYTWKRLGQNIDNMYALGLTFPWLPSLLVGFELHHMEVDVPHKSEREDIRRQVAAICSGKVPHILPGLTTWVNTVCKSGKELISQYRMLEASVRVDENITPRVRIDNISSLLPTRFITELHEVIEEWMAKQAYARAELLRAKRKIKR